MIVATPDDAVFPENVIKCLKIVLPGIDPEPDPTKKIQILSRPLRPTDPQQCIGCMGRYGHQKKTPMRWATSLRMRLPSTPIR
jgi:hypothetical protein